MTNLLKKHNLVGFLSAVFLLGIDLFLKTVSASHFVKYEEGTAPDLYIGRREELFSFGGDFVVISFNHVRNFGAMWNIAAGLDKSFRPFLFTALSLVSFVVLFFVYKLKWVNPWLLLLITVGAASNMFDRIRYGYVVDYFDARFQIFGRQIRFPNFNLADIYLIFGLSLALFLFFKATKEGKAS